MSKRRACLVEAVERRLLMASIQVLNTNDSGAGSLRDAIATAAAGDTIDLSALSGTIALRTEIATDKPFTLAGPGAATLTISGSGHTTRAFNLTGGSTTISDVRIADAGTPGQRGGAVLASNMMLTLRRCVIANNVATNYGGGIASEGFGVLSLVDTRLTGNLVVGSAANRLAAGGAVAVQSATLMSGNTTYDYNVAEADATGAAAGDAVTAIGGAIALRGTASAQLGNSTLAYNAARTAGTGNATRTAAGGALGLSDFRSTAVLIHVTVARNDAATGAGVGAINSSGTFTLRRSIASENGASDVAVAGMEFRNVDNVIGGDARLGAFGNHGGETQTIALLPYSPAINRAADAESAATDQRGVARQGLPDAGAFEYATATPTFSTKAIAAATESAAYQYTIVAADADRDALKFEAVTLPAWLTLTDHGDGTATLAGTPPAAGSYAVKVAVRDGGGIAPAQAFTIVAAAGPAVALVDGRLTVRGTDGKDEIQIFARPNGTQVRVSRNGETRDFKRSQVRAIDVDAMGGDDRVSVDVDTLGAAVYGGTGDDTITTGGGDDTLGGGGGADVLRGGSGNDVIRGHGGKDRLFGESGEDRLYGGDGNDSLDGGAHADRLYGEAGRDAFLSADAARDRLYGAADDVATADKRDLVYGITELTRRG